MKKIIPFFILIFCMLTSCNTATPERYFDLAVLNCNMMMGFANNGLVRELDQPSAKLVEGTKDKTEPMKRKEVIDDKIQYLEGTLEKIKALKETDDTKEMLQTSVALFEYTMPVYKTEYRQLAKLYDEGASKEQTEMMAQSIHDKYAAGFETLLNKLTAIGKVYAEKHNIKVNWGSL